MILRGVGADLQQIPMDPDRVPAWPTIPYIPPPSAPIAARGNLLLLLSIVVPLLTFLYDGAEPRLFGFPRFYWLQLSFVGLTVAFTG